MSPPRRIVAAIAAVALGLLAGFRPATAQVDMSRYVALGDSLSAGFADGSLYRGAQLGGYAARLARLGDAAREFEQPLMTDPGIPATLRFGNEHGSALVPRAGLGSPVNLTLPRPYDNLAVPGSKVGDTLRASTDGGGLRDLVLRGLGTQLEQALLLEPTFVSVWIGNADVLGAAVSGIVLDGVTLTPLDRFSRDFETLLQSLVAGGVGAGVVATIPRVGDLPYVGALATEALADTGQPLEVAGAPVPLLGPEGPLQEGDFVLLSASPLLARGDGLSEALGGSGRALPDEVILSRHEAHQINDRIRQYNSVIRRIAADVGFGVVETADLFEEWNRDGVRLEPTLYGTEVPGGGLFSLDGLHPSPLGQALLTNAFVETINDVYGAEIPRLKAETLAAIGRKTRALGAPAGSQSRFVFSSRASRNLRFALAIPRPARLLRWKRRALERSRELERRRRRPIYELPPEPVLAGLWLRAAGSAPRLISAS